MSKGGTPYEKSHIQKARLGSAIVYILSGTGDCAKNSIFTLIHRKIPSAFRHPSRVRGAHACACIGHCRWRTVRGLDPRVRYLPQVGKEVDAIRVAVQWPSLVRRVAAGW